MRTLALASLSFIAVLASVLLALPKAIRNTNVKLNTFSLPALAAVLVVFSVAVNSEVANAVDYPQNKLIMTGDVDCNSSVDSSDALKVLRYDAGLSYSQWEQCPEIGEIVAYEPDGGGTDYAYYMFGDTDMGGYSGSCSGSPDVDPVDAQRILYFDAYGSPPNYCYVPATTGSPPNNWVVVAIGSCPLTPLYQDCLYHGFQTG